MRPSHQIAEVLCHCKSPVKVVCKPEFWEELKREMYAKETIDMSDEPGFKPRDYEIAIDGVPVFPGDHAGFGKFQVECENDRSR